MSQEDRACAVPLWEMLRKIPKDYRVSIPFQWAENGAETGHHMIPVGHLMHRAADELAAQSVRSAIGATGDAIRPYMTNPTIEQLTEMAYILRLVPRGDTVCVDFLRVLKRQYLAAQAVAAPRSVPTEEGRTDDNSPSELDIDPTTHPSYTSVGRVNECDSSLGYFQADHLGGGWVCSDPICPKHRK